ncbi:MAG: bifunctional chorismate mutase/prephenate dehydratase [Balneolaceae bacterium]|nr:bifunctional chorismate mutase/prephenate dehydratase [Balneolaceae bacterium]
MNNELERIRKQLDRLDRNLIETLAKRHEMVRRVSDLKLENSREIRDTERENELLNKVSELARERGLDRHFAEELFREILEHSVRYQHHSLLDHQNREGQAAHLRVAYQGTDGAYSHMAAMRHFRERYGEVACYGYDTFHEAADAVSEGACDVAILPVENTTAGSINDTYDILGNGNLHITGEEILRVVHCLMAPQDVPLESIRRIISHPQAIAQCSRFLGGLNRCRVESYIDTAKAARKVLEDGDLSQAAVAGAQAAKRYGLVILKHDLANQSGNFTRFVVVAPEPVRCDPQIPAKTSLLLETDHREGQLLKCLQVLGDAHINMTKLESRPRPNRPWKYRFYLDIEGNAAETPVREALDEMELRAGMLRVLGSYPSGQPRSEPWEADDEG